VALVHGSEGNITRIYEERTAAYREGDGSREVARDRPSIAVFDGPRNGCVDRSSVLGWSNDERTARVKDQGTVTPTQDFAVHVDGIERGFPETKPTLIF